MTQDEQKALGEILRLIKEGREDPRIYEISREVISQSGTTFGYDIDELEALYQFIAGKNGENGRVRYVRDPYGRDTYQGAVDTLDKFKTGDCLAGDTKILCVNRDNEYESIKIQDLKDFKGIYAVSYNFQTEKIEHKPIIDWWDKGKKASYKVQLTNGTTFYATINHRVWARKLQKSVNQFTEKKLSDIDLDKWCRNQILCIRKLSPLNKNIISFDQAWIEGNYAAEGFSDPYHIRLAGDDKKVQWMLMNRLENLKVPHSISKRKKHAYINVGKSPLKKTLSKMGQNSMNKELLNDRLSMSEKHINNLLEGYVLGDGHLIVHKLGNYAKAFVYGTSSNHLAEQLRMLHYIIGKPLYSYYQSNHGGVGRNPIWRLSYNPNSFFNKPTYPNLSKVGIKFIKSAGQKRVFDITVEDNHNFFLSDSGVLVHNCEDLAILLASMVLTVGYPVSIKLVSVAGELWDHIYPLAGVPPEEPEKWVAMDATLVHGRLGQEPEREYEKMFRITNGLASNGEAYRPPGDWQEKVLKYFPLIIIAPFAVFFIKEAMSRR